MDNFTWILVFFFSSRRRHTRFDCDWSSDVCSSDLAQTHEVEVEGNRVTVDGVGLETDLAPVSGTPLYHLLLGGASWTVAAEPLEGAGRWTLGLVGERVEVAVQDERSRRIEAASGQSKRSGGGGTVRAPMPGL